MTKTDYNLIRDAAELIKEDLKANAPDKVGKFYALKIHGFGTLKIKRVASKKGRNPATGEAVTIPERFTVKFSPSKTWFAERF